MEICAVPVAPPVNVAKVIALAGTCGVVLGFGAGFRSAEHIYATEREIEMMYRKIKMFTGVAIGAAAVAVIITTLVGLRVKG